MGNLGKRFTISRRVNPLSPNFFNSILEQLFRELNIEHLGINISGKKITNFRFADDVALFYESEND